MLVAGPAGIGAPEIIIICIVLLILFGAKKLPDFARGSGRALRIFKAETKGLMDDDEDNEMPSTAQSQTTPPPSAQAQETQQRQIESTPAAPVTPVQPKAEQPQVDSQTTDTDR
jgi:sec-independent protein translocase protein TatA